MIKAALYQYLIADAGLAALIGDRVYPQLIPQRAWNGAHVQPCAVYQRVGITRDVRYCGTSGLARSAFQIDAYATEYENADAVARAIKSALIDFRGAMTDVHVHAVMLEVEFDQLDPEPGLFRVSMTFSLWHDAE